MTQREIEMRWAHEWGTTLEKFYLAGFHAVPCSCGLDICDGWQLAKDGNQFLPYLKPVDPTQ